MATALNSRVIHQGALDCAPPGNQQTATYLAHHHHTAEEVLGGAGSSGLGLAQLQLLQALGKRTCRYKSLSRLLPVSVTLPFKYFLIGYKNRTRQQPYKDGVQY